MEAIKGITCKWHASNGKWANRNKLKTLCGTAISPNYRRNNTRVVNCDKCLGRLKDNKGFTLLELLDSYINGKGGST